ncbi:MAG: hypothetical protein Tp1123DCM1511741_15 [Prokaryotic dsDNA virus sp.]|nr:MAG: hypothetical protein Tp1123DCM1511741_15 [Prokaryotic dsDNA virus sp.]|tara:strand:+ start:24361 stop:25398 length:1038 start_codon:yes stop_codon:yes gene_type:complete
MPSTKKSSISFQFAQDIVRAWNLPNMTSQKDVFEYLGKNTDSGTMSFYRKQAEEITGIELLPHNNKFNQMTRLERQNLPPLTNHVKVQSEPYTMVVFSDAHFEGYETPSYLILLEVLKDLTKTKELKAVVANGDMLDLSILSTFAKYTLEVEPKLRTVQQEIYDSQEQLSKIQRIIDKAERKHHMVIHQIATYGNHELRLSKYVSRMGIAFEDFQGFTMHNIFPDWQWAMSHFVDDTVMIKHNMRGGIHSTYQNAYRAGVNIITGHTHQLNARTWVNYNSTNLAVATGHLSEPYHSYQIHNVANDWHNGFAVVKIDPKEKTIHPELVYVNNHFRTAYFRGKKYKV